MQKRSKAVTADCLSAGSEDFCSSLDPALIVHFNVYDSPGQMHKSLNMSLTVNKNSSADQKLMLLKCL